MTGPFRFDGRIGRGLYWMVQLPLIAAFWMFGRHVDPLLARWFPYSVFEGLACALVLAAPLIWVQFAIAAQRFRDRGKSGFWSLLLLVPVLGWIWIAIECGLFPGVTASVPTARRSVP